MIIYVRYMVNFFVIILIGLLGLVGVWLSDYIRRKRVSKEKLVCPIGFDCQTVVTSKYSKFFGIPVENLGILYYLLVSISYAVFLFFPKLHHEFFSFAILSVTILAFLFSIYLTFIQLVVLGRLCSLCLASGALCALIFIFAWTSTNLDIIGFLNSVIQILPL